MLKELIKKLVLSGLIMTIGLFAGCNSILNEKSPREAYLEGLEKAGLLNTELGRQWIDAGNEAFNNPVSVNLPYAEKGYFSDNLPEAAGLKIKVQKGEKLKISLTDEDSSGTIFVELYTNDDKKSPETYFFEKDSLLNFKPDKDGEILLLIQPELLKKGYYSLVIEKSPVLNFPVKGKDGKAIGSFWNDIRDGGKRLHQGVDIFAKKGTPVVAADDGIIYYVGTNRLGGKVVWQRIKDYSLYYAHLDSQLVSIGKFVKAGDTLGLVGNTGNAKFTSPHLHFGIYTMGGAIDPYPFVNDYYKQPEEVIVNTNLFGRRGTMKKKIWLYSEPDKNEQLTRINPSEEFRITGGSGKFYKVLVNESIPGYMSAREAEQSISKN